MPDPLIIETDREADGRWIAEVRRLPGTLAYGKTRKEAIWALRRHLSNEVYRRLWLDHAASAAATAAASRSLAARF